ncbi:MAG: hypothetical protein LAO78_20380 [Acidobacteriia bacterium]|nr:hypothetical protein [Terriglobia bacterium]
MTNERDSRVLVRIGARELAVKRPKEFKEESERERPAQGPSPAHPNGDAVPAACGNV